MVIDGARFTVLGAGGYVGAALAAHLAAAGASVRAVGRDERPALGGDLGHVIDCAGLSSDARERPLDAMDAHVTRVVDLLRGARLASLLVLSSTRVYGRARSGHENAALVLHPADPRDLFAASKLAAEAVCLADARPTVRVVRLATVYGGSFASPNFLCSLLEAMTTTAALDLPTDAAVSRDYVHLDDVVDVLPRIALTGEQRLVNVASGVAVRNDALVAALEPRTGCRVRLLPPPAPVPPVPPIAIDRVRDDVGFAPRALPDTLDAVLAEFRRTHRRAATS